MSDDARERQAGGEFAAGENAGDRNEHRHGDVVHSHEHRGPHEHADDLEYDEAHDPEAEGPPGSAGQRGSGGTS